MTTEEAQADVVNKASIKVVDCVNPVYADFWDDTVFGGVWAENRELNIVCIANDGVEATKDFLSKFEFIIEAYALCDDVELGECAIVLKRLLRWHLFNEPMNV